MNYVNFKTLLVVSLLVAHAGSAFGQSQDPLSELKNCARINDHDSRIACYEALGERVLAEEVPEAATAPTAVESVSAAAAPVAAATAPQLGDELGGEEFEKKPDPAKVNERGLIVSCKKGPDKKWYFYFDNGQVWKQIDDRRLSLKEDCEVLATISKDWFGYKMKTDDLKGIIRVSRRR